jgi:hypothetical protein
LNLEFGRSWGKFPSTGWVAYRENRHYAKHFVCQLWQQRAAVRSGAPQASFVRRRQEPQWIPGETTQGRVVPGFVPSGAKGLR